MNKLPFYSVLFLSFYSCNDNRNARIDNSPYRISFSQLKVDTAIRTILYFKDYFLCLQENLKVAVFDSNLVRKKNIEDSVNAFLIAGFFGNNDTVFLFKDDPKLLGYPKNEFYFTSDFKLQKRKYLPGESSWPVNSWPLYVDSIYDVYANQIGSGGFLVFFYHKQSKKTYSMWSSGPRQVLQFNNSYYVTEEGDYKISPGFRIIPDPQKLINVPNDKVPGLIQVFQHLAPSPGVYYEGFADSIEKSKCPVYGSSQSKYLIPVYTFIKENKLHTIIKADSSIYLAVHKNDSLIKVQTILDTSIEMRSFSYERINKNHFVTFGANGGKMIDNKMQSYSSSGFILIKDSSININYYYSHKPYDIP